MTLLLDTHVFFWCVRRGTDVPASALSRLPALALPVTTEPALLAGTLEWTHRDPFDRLLAAQALTDDLTLVTADDAFSSVAGLSLLRW